MLIVPRKRIWTQQPQGAAQIDPYWISRGLRFVINPATGPNNNGVLPIQSSAFATEITPDGIDFAGNSRAEFGDILPSANGLTLISVWKSRLASQYLTTDSTRNILSNRIGANKGWAWGRISAIAGGATGNLTRQIFTVNGVADYNESNYKIESLVTTPVAMRYSKARGNVSWFRFGVNSSADTTATTSPSVGGNVVYGEQGAYGSGTNVWIDRAGIVLGFVGELSDSEIYYLTNTKDAPWKIYLSQDSHIFVPTGGASTATYTIYPTGSLVFNNNTPSIKTNILPTSGNITYSGTNNIIFSNGATTYTITPSGSINYINSNILEKERVLYTSGNITYSGSVVTQHIRLLSVSGLITYTGSVNNIKIKIVNPTGKISYTGTNPIYVPGSGTITTRLPLTGAGN